MAAMGVVMGDVQIVEFRAAVVADQARRLLVVRRRDVEPRRCGVAEILLPPRHQRLLEHAADALAAVEAQVPRPRRQAEQPVGIRRAQPLKVDRQLRRIELGARRRRRKGMRWQGGRRRLDLRHRVVAGGAQPAIGAPHHRLDRGLAPQHAAAAIAQRPAAQIGHPGLAGLGLDQVAMAGALQLRIGAGACAQDVGIGMQLVRSPQVARPRHRHRVVPAGAAFRRDQIVPAVPLVEMRRLGEAQRGAFEDHLARADEAALVV
ncbi:MAG: hypothetical protein WDN03_17165 [Rhizomicrobium sp.]